MVVYYDSETGSYSRNYPAFYMPPDDRHPHASGAMPSYHYNTSTTSLRIPDEERRGRQHRSLPPPARRDVSWERSRRRRQSPSQPVHPIGRAQTAIKDTFTDSTSGVGVGILGAIIGGLVAREASDAASKSPSSMGNKNEKGGSRYHHYQRQQNLDAAERTRLISTLVGAAVGGFGANALEKRIEVGRQRTAEKEEAWEKKWGKDSRGGRVDRDEQEEEEENDRGRRRHSHGDRRYNRNVYVRGSAY